jgi:membrane protease subunit HflK
MSRGDSPWGGGNDSPDTAAPDSGDTPPAGGDDPVRNPWLSPDEASTPRRSAGLEDILRGGGNGSGGNGPLPTRLLPWLGLALISAWLAATSLHFLAQNERALVTTMGRYAGTIGPGFNVTLPWPLQSVQRSEVGKEAVTTLPDKEAETLMLTRDGELVNLSFQVRWRIADLRAYTYNLPEGEAAIRRLADAQMRAAVAEFDFTTITGARRQAEMQARVAGRMQRVLDAWRSGVSLSAVEVIRTAPPERLAKTFEKIDAAAADARKNQDNARAWRDQHLKEARAEARDFQLIYGEYKLAPEVTRQRMYYETMARVLRNNDTVILGGNAAAGVAPPNVDPAKGGR